MRFVPKASAVVIALAVLLPSNAHASVDITGSWSVVLDALVGSMNASFEFVQTGTQLDLTYAFEQGAPQGPYTGTIDPNSGVFTVPLPDSGGMFSCSGSQISGIAASNGQSISGGWAMTFFNIHGCIDGGGPYTGVPSRCGDGVLNAGEVCDDGNVLDGDCCTADCSAAAADATPCDDGNACTTGDQCSAGRCGGGTTMYCDPCEACSPGGCIIPEDAGCQAALGGGRAKILIRDRSDDPTKDAINWSWKSSATVAVGDFGNPQNMTDYSLCVIDRTGGVPTLRMRRAVPSVSSFFSPKPAWQSTKKGFSYARKDAQPEGITGLTLGAGDAGHGKIGVKGKGALLAVPTGPFTAPVTVRLVRHDSPICWDATYSAPHTNDGAVFKAKSD